MAKFIVTLGDGQELGLEIGAIDNVPELMSELTKHGFVAGRDHEGPVAVCLPHVATVRPVS